MEARHQETWFRAYCAAVLETDRSRVSQRVAVANQAIAIRVAELHSGVQAIPRESRDLGDATRNLQLLVKYPLS